MNYDVLMFDCYGTLIDWETGIVSALSPILLAHGIAVEREAILTAYSEIEPEIQSGEYLSYREVLQRVVAAFGNRFGFDATESECDVLPKSLCSWQPFPDALSGLEKLRSTHQLAVLSNIDRDLFEASDALLGRPFSHIFTADAIGSYKPHSRNFAYALDHLPVGRDSVLHVAESLFHDIAPARKAGLATVWVNRRGEKGVAASRLAPAKPNMTVSDLDELVRALGL